MSLRFVLPAFALLLPLLARADGNPDFERDAKPILSRQPGLVQYIHTHYLVQEIGLAKFSGTADHPPGPPFIFNAKPRGASGPFYLRLLIQPGPPGRILRVADIRKLQNGAPPQENAPAMANGPVEPAAAPTQSVPVQQDPIQTPASTSSQPASSSTAPPGPDVPSGPIPDSGSAPASSGSSSSLTPPPDPAPATP